MDLVNPFKITGNWFEQTFGTQSNPSNYSDFVNANYPSMLDLVRKQALEDREYNSMREDTYYQRMMNSLQQAGINPLIAFSNGGVGSMPLNQNSNISGSSEAVHKLLQGYLGIFDKVKTSNLDDAEKWSKIWKNIAGGFSGISSLF